MKIVICFLGEIGATVSVIDRILSSTGYSNFCDLLLVNISLAELSEYLWFPAESDKLL